MPGGRELRDPLARQVGPLLELIDDDAFEPHAPLWCAWISRTLSVSA
jgi:hypothetical protein